MKRELVSIIIPTKNETKNLPRLIGSIKKQTYKSIEAIVVDTGSNDETVGVAQKFGIRVYHRGPERSAARNFGVSKAKGKYLLIIDADMQLSPKVVEECVSLANKKHFKALVIPEKTVGKGFLTKIRRFEREMYMNEPLYEVARFFEKSVFQEFGGYDLKITGPEDYDLPYRISKKYQIGRISEYIYHHEANVGLSRLLKKKYYYANRGATYANKHPELILRQGNLLFRKVYLRHWRKFIKKPLLGVSFIFIRVLESLSAILGYLRNVGIIGFVKTFFKAIKL